MARRALHMQLFVLKPDGYALPKGFALPGCVGSVWHGALSPL